MTFANPNALWLLLVFPPALVVFFWWSVRKRRELMSRFIQARLLPGLLSGISPAREKMRFAGLVLAVVCLVLALARPQWGFTWEEVKQRGLDIVVAVDTSKSMLAEDIPPNRLARAKLATLELMQRAKSDRLGLVAFAGSAFLQCPLTIDDAVFRQSVEALDVHTISEGGTAIAEAIQTALTAFKEGDNHKVLVLFSDGEDHDSGALEAAKKAAEAGLQIFTIGIGSTEGELLRIKDAKGGSDYIRDEQGNVVKSHLNETLLQEIAGATERGFYLPLRGAKAIDTLYEKGLAPWPKGEGNEKLSKRMHERYQWPLAIGILLLIAEMLFPERKREAKMRPVPAGAPAAKPVLQRAVAALLLVALPLASFGSPASALRDYKAEQYDQALKEYEQLLKRKGDDPRLHYNAGASAYRNRQFEEADKQFDAALNSPLTSADLKLQSRAYYNRGNTRFYLGATAPDPNQRKETWKKALQDYQNSIHLNPQDTDAKYNYDFVKKRLEELQQQQQQNQQDKNDKQQDQDQQKQQQDQQKQDQQKQDQQKDQNQQQQQAQQKQSDQKQDANQQKQQAQQQKQEEQKQQEAKDKKEQQAKQASAQPKDKSDEKDQKEGQAYAEGQMTPQQAQQLLDAQKDDEQMLPPVKPDQKPVDQSKPIRDW